MKRALTRLLWVIPLLTAWGADELRPITMIQSGDPRLPESLQREAQAAFDRGCAWLRDQPHDSAGWSIGTTTNRTTTLLPALPLALDDAQASREQVRAIRQALTITPFPGTTPPAPPLERVVAFALLITDPEEHTTLPVKARQRDILKLATATELAEPFTRLTLKSILAALAMETPPPVTDAQLPPPAPPFPLSLQLALAVEAAMDARAEQPDSSALMARWKLPPQEGGMLTLCSWAAYLGEARIGAFKPPGSDLGWRQPTHELARHIISTQKTDPRTGMGYWDPAGQHALPEGPVPSTALALLTLQALL